MSKVHDKNVKDDDFDVDSEFKKPTFGRSGDILLPGRHRLVCCGSALPETYNVLMEGKKANLVVTDPPYQC